MHLVQRSKATSAWSSYSYLNSSSSRPGCSPLRDRDSIMITDDGGGGGYQTSRWDRTSRSRSPKGLWSSGREEGHDSYRNDDDNRRRYNYRNSPMRSPLSSSKSSSNHEAGQPGPRLMISFTAKNDSLLSSLSTKQEHRPSSEGEGLENKAIMWSSLPTRNEGVTLSATSSAISSTPTGEAKVISLRSKRKEPDASTPLFALTTSTRFASPTLTATTTTTATLTTETKHQSESSNKRALTTSKVSQHDNDCVVPTDGQPRAPSPRYSKTPSVANRQRWHHEAKLRQ
jgi:hypothetical protein